LLASGAPLLYRGDAIEALRAIPSASVDLVITDPAYESLEKHRRIGTTTRLKVSKSSSNEWFDIFPNARFAELFAELHRVLKKNSHLYLYCDQETMFVAKPLAEAAGFKFWKPIVWDKQAIGMGYHYRARYEFILFFEKGKRRLADLGIPDVLSFKRIAERVSDGEAGGALRGAHSPVLERGRSRARSLHGVGLGRHRCSAEPSKVHRQ
jgi:site-specific DNA-methyltransferase (adenine-specific)